MAFKKLASNKPAATTVTTLYTAPVGVEVIGTLLVVNSGDNDDVVTAYLADPGDSSGAADNVAFTATIPATSTMQMTGLTLYDGQFIEVESTQGASVFTLVGREG